MIVAPYKALLEFHKADVTQGWLRWPVLSLDLQHGSAQRQVMTHGMHKYERIILPGLTRRTGAISDWLRSKFGTVHRGPQLVLWSNSAQPLMHREVRLVSLPWNDLNEPEELWRKVLKVRVWYGACLVGTDRPENRAST